MVYQWKEVEFQSSEEEARVKSLGDRDESVKETHEKLESLHLLYNLNDKVKLLWSDQIK